jgi:hypothetical protein
MQSDGNLVLYDVLGHPVWTSNTEGNPHSKLVLQDDGNLVIYDAASGRPLWTRGNGRLACKLFSNIQANPGSIYIPRGQVNLDFNFTYSVTVVSSSDKQDPIIIHLRGPAGDFKIATYYSIPSWSLSTTEGVLNGGFKFFNSQAGTYRIVLHLYLTLGNIWIESSYPFLRKEIIDALRKKFGKSSVVIGHDFSILNEIAP